MLRNILRRSAIAISLFMMLPHQAMSSYLANTLDDWIDPALRTQRGEVLKVMSTLQNERNPHKDEHEDYGFTNQPGTKFDWQFLSIVNSFHQKMGERPRVMDLGCGLGHMSILAMFAGGHVTAVDFKTTLEKTNKDIFTKTKNILGYTAKQAGNYYRAVVSDLTSPLEEQAWTKYNYEAVICKDVLHFLKESEITAFAKNLFSCAVEDGAIFIQVDTPTYNKQCYDFYKTRQGKALCPGLAVYNKKRGNHLELLTKPIAYDEAIHKCSAGYAHQGIYQEDGTVKADPTTYHNVRNVFLCEDLARIFEQAGFKLSHMFYLTAEGRMLTDGALPTVGKVSKACILLTKPVTLQPMINPEQLEAALQNLSVEDLEFLGAMLLGQNLQDK